MRERGEEIGEWAPRGRDKALINEGLKPAFADRDQPSNRPAAVGDDHLFTRDGARHHRRGMLLERPDPDGFRHVRQRSTLPKHS